MMASIISLVLFVVFVLSADVSTSVAGGENILALDGLKLLNNLVFLISAAGLGAGFAALYKANSFITQGTFDPTYHVSYWIRFFLGLIAALVLSVMVSGDALDAHQGSTQADSTLYAFLDPGLLRPMLAMLGGFSADLLYTIMNRLVETVESLFRGSTKNFIAVKQEEANALLAASKVQSKIDVALKLLKFQQELKGE